MTTEEYQERAKDGRDLSAVPLSLYDETTLEIERRTKKRMPKETNASLLFLLFAIRKEKELEGKEQARLSYLIRKKVPFAFFLLGECYRLGILPFKKDKRKAILFYRRADEGCVPEARSRLFLLDAFGKRKQRTANLRTVFLRKDGEDILAEGTYLLRHGRIRAAREVLEIGARQGVVESFYLLGKAWLLGGKEGRNYENAALCFERGASYGDRRAVLAFAECLFLGRGVFKDLRRAATFFEEADGDSRAAMRLGDIALYLRHLQEAKGYYERAVRMGQKAAEKRLLYMKRRGLLPRKGAKGIKREGRRPFSSYRKDGLLA